MASTRKRSRSTPRESTDAAQGDQASRSSSVAAARGKSAPKRSSSGWRENAKSLLGALLIYLFLRTFLVEAFRIPSGSMEPTLLVGDWLFVNKLRYGPHIPFTNINLPGYADPERGDVVVFVSPPQLDQPWDPSPTLVKRLVGVPGDTLFMRSGMLYLNGDAQPQAFDAGVNPVGDPNEVSPLFEWQVRADLEGSRFGDPPAQPTHDNWGPIVIPPDHLFMMGDSRYNSKDSRYWGLVPRENVRGRPMFVYYSWNATDSDRALPAITDIRWGRLFTWIR